MTTSDCPPRRHLLPDRRRRLAFIKMNLVWLCALAVTAVLLFASIRAQEFVHATPLDKRATD